jgi:hypothetical protein
MIFGALDSDLHILAAGGRDPVTDTYDTIFLLSRSTEKLDEVGRRLLSGSFFALFIK